MKMKKVLSTIIATAAILTCSSMTVFADNETDNTAATTTAPTTSAAESETTTLPTPIIAATTEAPKAEAVPAETTAPTDAVAATGATDVTTPATVPAANPAPLGSKGNPKTGDSSTAMYAIPVAMASLAAAVVIAKKKDKKE